MSLDFAKRHLILLLFAFFCLNKGTKLQAQIEAPDFLCVQNDTLRWNIPTNSCGTFNGYVIYSSQAPSGPYNVLTTVTDQAQTAFFHDGAGNQTWYYYLESDLNCPGLPRLKSDTLDNRIPEPGPISVATVEDGTSVRVDWKPSPSPEVTGYIVSRQNALGTTILDTIYDGLSYLDTGAAPDQQSETYFVVALDPCGNVSLVPDPFKTIFLEITSVDSCSQAVNMSWSPYENGQTGVDRYEILVSEANPSDGRPGPYAVAGAVAGNTTGFTFANTRDGQLYYFKVRAVSAGNAPPSLSNETSAAVGVVQAIQDLVITGLEVSPDMVTVRWVLQPDIDLSSAKLYRSENGSDFSPVSDIDARSELYQDMTPLAYRRALTYRIEATDLCGNMVISNEAATIYLSGEANRDSENELRWTPFYNEAGELIRYEFYRISGATPTFLAAHAEGELMHKDPVDLGDPSQASLCYQVIAEAEINLSDQSLNGARTVSNVFCLEQSAQLFVPNAFVPNGVNREFKPVLQFGNSQEYLMTIFDRFGGVVFESRELTTGWDGTKNGKPLPQGMYVFLIKMTHGSGNVIEKKGTVLLLR